jgi:phosphorylcholine metabolism protein LicD
MNGFLRISIGIKEHMTIIKNIIINNIELFDMNCIHQFLTPTNHIWKLKLLFKKLITIFNNNNIEYWLDGGTLLGYYRYKGIIPWDDDIDIAILNNNITKIENLKDILYNNNIRLKKNKTNVYYQVDFLNDIIDENITNAIHIDIFLFEKKDNKYFNTDNRFIINDDEKCNYIYDENNLFPLIKSEFYNIPIYIPNNVDNILSQNIKGDYINYAILTKNNVKHIYNLNNNIMISA